MRCKLAALMLCVVGMGALDHVLRLLADLAVPDYVAGSGFEAWAAAQHLKSRVIGFGEIIGVTALCLLALRLSFPGGIRRNAYAWTVALILALTAGRSFLGIGEGFTASFYLLVTFCQVVALWLHAILPRRPG